MPSGRPIRARKSSWMPAPVSAVKIVPSALKSQLLYSQKLPGGCEWRGGLIDFIQGDS